MKHTAAPIDLENAVQIVETLSVRAVIASWKSDFGIDVTRLFAGVEGLQLRKDRVTGQLAFYPPIEGDEAFYQDLRKFNWYHPPTKEEFVAAAAYHQPGQRIIDVGAGVGGFASHVSKESYLGLETDAEAVKAATAKGVSVANMDMATYRAAAGFAPARLVTAFQVLEHVSKPKAFIADMVTLAEEGGYVAIGVPDAESYVAELPDFMLNAPPHHLTWWTEAALAAAMMQAGLWIEAVHRFGVEPWERQLWWMAKLASLARPKRFDRFGKKLRTRKVLSYVGAWGLQKLPIPTSARGSTLLMIGRKTTPPTRGA